MALYTTIPTNPPHHRHHPSTSSSSSTSSSHSPPTTPNPRRRRQRYTHRLPLSRIFTRNVVLTLLASFALAFHVGTFNSLWFVFLSTPVASSSPSSSSPPNAPPWHFSGGLGLPPHQVGTAMAILGILGITLQLLVYPRLSARLGTVPSWRLSLCCFPLAYLLVPLLALVPSTTTTTTSSPASSSTPPNPPPKTGIAVWTAIAAVLAVQVLGRTFALPAQTILVNNCSPHPSVLGTLHGLGQMASSFARTLGPVLGGHLYGLGLEAGVVGAVWWALAAVAVLGAVTSLFVWEGDGHEVWLEGDELEEDELEGELEGGTGRGRGV